MKPPGSSRSAKARFVEQAGRPNTLRLHGPELAQLLDQYDASSASHATPQRGFVRWSFRHPAVPMQIVHSNGTAATVTVACRNLSRAGMAVLHSAFLHHGTRCTVALPHPERGAIKVDGWVARCVHRSGMIHELGITFAEPIDVRQFMRCEPLSDHFSMETVDPAQLQGSLLCISPSQADHQIITQLLMGSNLRISAVTNIDEVLPQLHRPWDLIIVDLSFPAGAGRELIHRLRSCGYDGAIIATTGDTSEASRLLLTQIDADAFLPQPVSPSLLLRAMGEFLIANRTRDRPLTSTLPLQHPDFSLVEGFVLSLRHSVKKLEDAVRRDDRAGCLSICQQLSVVAPRLGFESLGSQATDACEALTRTGRIAESVQSIRTLIATCERIRLRKCA